MFKSLLLKLKIDLLRGKDLKFQVARSSAFLGLGSAFGRALQVFRTMILARLIAPEEFGLIAMSMMVIVMLESLADAGIRLSIIQNEKGSSHSYLNAAWWIAFGRGIGLFIFGLVCAPYIADFYQKPELSSLLRVSFLAFILNGIISPRAYLLEREFRFGKATLLNQLSAVIMTVITLITAFYVRNAWALVVGIVCERIAYCVITFITCPFKPQFDINRGSTKEIFKFSKGMFGLSLMNLIARQADVMALGKMVSASALGSYYLSMKLAEQPLEILSQVIAPVLLPAFSAKQNDKVSLLNGLQNINRGIALFGLPFSTIIAVYAYVMLYIFYGENYTSAAGVLPILAFNIYFRMHTVVLAQMFFAHGLPNLHRRGSFIRTIVIIVTIYPMIKLYGVNGAAFILLISNAILMVSQIVWIKPIIYLSLFDYFTKWLPGAVLAVFTAFPLLLYRFTTLNSIFIQIFIGSITFAIVCMIALLWLKKEPLRISNHFKRTIRSKT
jgi:lipopolysaccharide exporter